MKMNIKLDIADGTPPELVGACVRAGIEDWLIENGYPTAAPQKTAKRIRIKCTEVRLSNVSYVHCDGGDWRCVLANGIPAGMSYAGVLGDETKVRFKLEDATTPEEALEVMRAAGGRHWTYELV